MDETIPIELGDTDRFRVISVLGSGASGTVYETYDRERRCAVALKVLTSIGPGAIYRFKKEFRALADVDHPNLVQLYELLSDGERWFYTMELVRGSTFLDYVRDGCPAPAGGDQQTASDDPDCGEAPADTTVTSFDEGRLRGALKQLAEGLAALHDSGKLHRDLKPSNILVTPLGRVVLLDLGLVREVVPQRIYESLDEGPVGTPAYMSPEQAAGLRVTPASDWYAVGAVLYQVLSGRLPFSGTVIKIMVDKQSHDPPAPIELCPAVPADLNRLCMALLRREPQRRPSGLSVLHALGSAEGRSELSASSIITSTATGRHAFIGRERHLAVLHDAYEATRGGRSVTVLVHGSSGMGKSMLMRRFLEDLHERHEDAVVLAGRCYQRESVPYKALDSLMDSLSRYLRSLDDEEVEKLLPDSVLALVRLFPVLSRVQAVTAGRFRMPEIPDSREMRRRAFAALRELFHRLACTRPLVLFIDDLQWGDIDSLGLLAELLRPPDPPMLMLAVCFRSEEAVTSPILRQLLSSELSKAATMVRELMVDELSQEHSRSLARRLVGDRVAGSDELVCTIARESGGNPFLLETLVRHAVSLLPDAQESEGNARVDLRRALSETSLESVVEARLAELPTEARLLAELVAVAGRPLELEILKQAARVGENLQSSLAALRAARLIRMRGGRSRDEIEIYHNRVREAMLKLLDPEVLRSHHLRLAVALQSGRHADPETLAVHYEKAGQLDRAAELAARAAERASEALAFDRAARLNRIALEFPIGEEGAYRALQIRLGSSLENAGRGAEAAQAFLAAADGAKPSEALELRRRAAEQLLISGHIDEGVSTVHQVLASIGMRLARTPTRAVLSILWRRLRLRLRGIRFKERDTSQIPPQQLIRIDTCWSVSVGLGIADTIRGMDFGKRHVLLALNAGEPYRVARALAIEAAYSATAGSKALVRTQELNRAASRLAERVEQPHALGLTNMTSGIAAYLEGRWSRAMELLTRAEEILRERCIGVTWEIDTSVMFQLRALLLLGNYGEICQRLPALLREVHDRGDLYAETNMRARVSWVVAMVEDRTDSARQELNEAMQRWSQQGFHLQHYWQLTGLTELAMYQGKPLAGWHELQELWAGLARSMMLRIQFTRTEALHLRARCALAAAVEVGTGNPLYPELRMVMRKDLRRIEREGLAWALPLAQLVQAGLQASENRRSEAIDLLAEAINGFEEAEMSLHAQAARRSRGLLLGGERGKEQVDEAEAWMVGQGIESPDRMARVLAPGGWE